jgi:putative sigma-54 modulation protein
LRLQVKGKNVEVSESIKGYAQEKLGKLEKQLNDDSTLLELELTVEKNPSIAENQIAEATVWTKGPVLRVRESSPDMRASIDQLVDKLERQAQRYRDKRRPGRSRAAEAPAQPPNGEPLIPGEEEPVIVKTKQWPVKPMTPEEAILQLELIGHDFFVFVNADTGAVNVVYRRRDGNYGLIEPQLA